MDTQASCWKNRMMTADPLALAEEAEALSVAATPGPWEPQQYEAPDLEWFVRIAGPDKSGGLWEDSTSTTEANARFIARARTLLPEMAKALREWHKRALNQGALDVYWQQLVLERDRLRALLAEAREALRPFGGRSCQSWQHNAETCSESLLAQEAWCCWCRARALLAKLEEK